MKFIHCADLHLGSKICLPTEISKTIKEENFRAFEKLCDYAKNNEITAVIICGDMFESSKVSNQVFKRAMHAVETASNVDFLCLYGNHDFGIFEEYSEEIPKNFKIFGDSWTTFSYGNVDIKGVSFNNKNTEFIYDNLTLNQEKLNIVALHGQVVGYKSVEEAELVSIPKLKNKGIDYLALGHVHFYTNDDLDLRGKYGYSGCLNGRGFDELEEKGFVLIESEDDKIKTNFVSFSNRNFYQYDVNLSLFDDFFVFRDKLLNDLKQKYNQNSLIKIELVGERDEKFDLNVDLLKSYLEEDFFFVKIKDKSTLKIDLNDYLGDKSVKGEFIRTVFAEEMTEEERTCVIVCGLKALKGEI